MSKWSRHKEKWSDCGRCSLCETRTKTCLLRVSHGKVPCDLLFVGEAPGINEDEFGKPFIGPAGHLLDRIISLSVPEDVTYGITNLVACIPMDEENSRKFPVPPEYAIKACTERVEELLTIVKPKGIVCVGKYSQEWLPKIVNIDDIPVTGIIHPAAILRADESKKTISVQRCISDIQDFMEELKFA